MKKPFENWKERIKNLPTLRFEAVDESATTAKIDLDDKFVSISIPPDSPNVESSRITNNYERFIDFDEIGSGGTGVVHSCLDPHLNRKVALKLLRYEHAYDQEQRTRFVREARVMAQLEHPNILPVHELGVRADRSVYYSMKQVNGKSLREIIDGLIAEDPVFVETFQIGQLLDIFQHVCHAMAFAHSRGVIHRDLKPENILIGPFGEVLVMDWGLAKLMGEEEHHVTRHSVAELDKQLDLNVGVTTVDGEVSGTPFYMSPEQATGKSSEMDQRTDIYSLGVILYEVLALKRPIGGKTIKDILNNVVNGKYPSPRNAAPERQIPRELNAICLKAMSRNPGNRYQSADEVIADLEHFEAGEEVSVYQDNLIRKGWKWCRRHPIISSTTAAALLALIGTVGILGSMRYVKRTGFLNEGDRELAKAAVVQKELLTHVQKLNVIQRGATSKTTSDEEARQIALISELETKMSAHLRHANYLFTKAQLQSTGEVPERIVAVNRLKIEYLLATKDYDGLSQHMAFIKERVAELNAEFPNKDIVADLFRISEGKGRLSIKTIPTEQRVSLWKYESDDSGLLVPVFKDTLGLSPIDTLEIDKGSYLLVIAGNDDNFDVTSNLAKSPAKGITYYPLNIDHAETVMVTIPIVDSMPPGMIYVPAGNAYLGGLHSRNLRLHKKHIAGFLMKQYEVTFKEYLDFWMSPGGANKSSDLKARVRFDRDAYRYEDAWDDAGTFLPQLNADHPIVGVTHRSAEAYCSWLSRKLGREVRLPTAAEWEMAARGVDGREQVWGESEDPDLCFTLENKRAHERFGNWAPPGSFYADVSVYGIYDLSGNVREWTASTFTNSPFYQIKGGSAHLPQRFVYCSYSSDTPVVPSDVGFRYAMPLE